MLYLNSINILKTFIGSIVLFFPFLIKLLSNSKKIFNAKKIILHFGSGYGNHFTHHDLARYCFKKNDFLYIHFFETDRHNSKLGLIFDTEQISFKNNFKFKTFKKEITFGEVERSIMKPLYKLALFYCNLIKKNESKIFEFPYLYLKLNRLCKIFKFKINYETEFDTDNKSWLYFYYSFTQKYKFTKNYKLKRISKPSELYFKNKNICYLYLRYFDMGNNFKSMRSGHKTLEEYYKTINYLLESNYFIFLVGDHHENLQLNNKNILNINTLDKEQKEYYEIFAATNAELFIGEPGGNQYFGLYVKKRLLINYFPINYPYPGEILNKYIYDLKNKQIKNLDKNIDFKKQIELISKNSNYILKENSSEEIFNFFKKYLN